MDKVRAGIIGYGQRAPGLVSQLLKQGDRATVAGVCDLYGDRVDSAKNRIKEKYGIDVFGTTDPYALIDDPRVNTVIVASAWESHIPLTVYAMKKGKAVGCDVAGAYSLAQCFELVRTYEQTKTPVMLLENCCYGRREMMLLNMVKGGFFGELVHVDGAYEHDLRDEISDGIKIRHYRLRNYLNRNCENYPTHELGPIAKLLDINHGNRFVSLSSFSSKAAGLNEFIKTERADAEDIQNLRFAQGDIVTTVLRCAGGQTVDLKLITSLPCYCSYKLNVYGSKASFNYDADSFCNGLPSHKRWNENHSNADSFEDEWLHPMWKDYLKSGITGGHGGMDYLCIRDFVDCLIEQKPMPIDVYDMATWMAVTPLSEQSIANGGAPVAFPDFTNGSWLL